MALPNTVEKRNHERIEYEAPVELVLDDGSKFAAKVVNMSRGGAFVATMSPPKFGAKIVMRIEIPGLPDTAEIPCNVRWVKDNEGVGLQFEALRAIEVWALNKLLGLG